MTPSLPPQTGQVWTSLLLTKILNFFLQIISYCVIITIPFLGHHNTTSSFARGRRRTVVFLFSPQCQLVVMLALYTTSHGQSKGPKMVARGQCRRANGGQKRLAKTMYIWKQWKKIKTKIQNLCKLGIALSQAVQWGNTRLGYWRIAGSAILTRSITNEKLAKDGYYDLPSQYELLRAKHLNV